MITLGGIQLLCPSQNVAAYVEHNISTSDVLQFDDSAWNSSLLHLPTPHKIELPPIEIGVYYHPRCASQFGVGYFIVSEQDLVVLRPQAFTVDGPLALTLTLDERVNLTDVIKSQISVTVYCLPPRPLVQIVGEENLYLLTVVDSRFFWWYISTNLYARSTWADYLNQIAGAVDEVFTGDTVNSNYGNPSSRFTLYNQPIPLIIDAMADSIGQMYVRTLDGNNSLQVYSTASTGNINNIGLIDGTTTGDASTGDFIPQAGGVFDNTDIKDSLIPNSVIVVFGNKVGNAYALNPYTVEIYLNELGLSQYGAYTPPQSTGNVEDGSDIIANLLNSLTTATVGFEGQYTIVADPTAIFQNQNCPPTNFNQLQNYATQAATDYYLWQLQNVDQVLSGIANVTPNGLIDCIKWKYSTYECYTRFMRGRFTNRKQGRWRTTDFEGIYSSYLQSNIEEPSSSSSSSSAGCINIFSGPINRVPNFKLGVRQILGHDIEGCLIWVNLGNCNTNPGSN